MFPLLPFAVGLLTGAATIRLFKNENAKKQLTKAQDRLREATVSSLSAIEHSSAQLRSRLEPDTSGVPPPPAAAEAATAVVAKPARKRTTPRKSVPNSAPKAAKATQPKTGGDA